MSQEFDVCQVELKENEQKKKTSRMLMTNWIFYSLPITTLFAVCHSLSHSFERWKLLRKEISSSGRSEDDDNFQEF